MNFSAMWTTIKGITSKVISAVHTLVADVDKIEPAISAAVSLINPSAGVAMNAVTGILDAVEAAIEHAQADANSPVSVSLPAQLVADFKTARDAIRADLVALGVIHGTAPNPPAPSVPRT